MSRPLHSDVAEFTKTLRELEQTLLAQNQPLWAEKICKARLAAQNSDARSVYLFLGCIGGMGSLNDLCWNRSREHAELAKKIKKAFKQASALKKEL